MRCPLLLALLTPLRPAAAAKAAGNLNFNLNFGTALEECIRAVAKEAARHIVMPSPRGDCERRLARRVPRLELGVARLEQRLHRWQLAVPRRADQQRVTIHRLLRPVPVQRAERRRH